MTKMAEMAGETFGGWTVLHDTEERDRSGKRLWLCRCACGWERTLTRGKLTTARRRGAEGCFVCRGMVYRDITGMTFGRFTALRPHDYTPGGYERWWCRCACGTERAVLKAFLLPPSRRAVTVEPSCGCARREKYAAMSAASLPRRRVRQAWQRMKTTCRVEGVVMHTPWLASFETFLADVGLPPSPGHGLYKLSSAGGYVPGNVAWMLLNKGYRWARSTRLVTVQGKTMPLAAYAEMVGIHKEVLAHRIRKGMTPEQAAAVPVKHYRGWARKGVLTKARQQQWEQAAALLAAGVPVMKVVARTGVERSLLYDWRHEPAFAARVRELAGEKEGVACG